MSLRSAYPRWRPERLRLRAFGWSRRAVDDDGRVIAFVTRESIWFTALPCESRLQGGPRYSSPRYEFHYCGRPPQ